MILVMSLVLVDRNFSLYHVCTISCTPCIKKNPYILGGVCYDTDRIGTSNGIKLGLGLQMVYDYRWCL